MKSRRAAPAAVIFDMDGTITEPLLDFARIRREIGAGTTPILEFLASIEDEEVRRAARAKVDAWEREGAEASTLNPGVHELLDFLARRRIPTALLTRNNRESVDIVMTKHGLSFDVVVTADDVLPPKPSPEPVRHIAAALGVDVREVMMVGDFLYDVVCGREAGACTVFLRSKAPEKGVRNLLCEAPSGPTGKRFLTPFSGADYVIDDLRELPHILDEVPSRESDSGPAPAQGEETP